MIAVATELEKDVALPWDYFLRQREVNSSEESALERFRSSEWALIMRELERWHNYVMPEGLEPHWVAPRRAVLWAHEFIREKVKNEKGEFHLDNIDHGWKPQGNPHGLPIGNAVQLAAYLKKGFRLRPPSNGITDVEVLEAADPVEAQGESPKEPLPEYRCGRHEKGVTVFNSWDAYVAHCRHFKEVLEESPPQETLDKMDSHEYYCTLCNLGFNSKRLAAHHVQVERKKRTGHPTVEQMQRERA